MNDPGSGQSGADVAPNYWGTVLTAIFATTVVAIPVFLVGSLAVFIAEDLGLAWLNSVVLPAYFLVQQPSHQSLAGV